MTDVDVTSHYSTSHHHEDPPRGAPKKIVIVEIPEKPPIAPMTAAETAKERLRWGRRYQ